MIRNERVVRFARTLTLRYFFLLATYAARIINVLEYKVGQIKKFLLSEVYFDAVRAEF